MTDLEVAIRNELNVLLNMTPIWERQSADAYREFMDAGSEESLLHFTEAHYRLAYGYEKIDMLNRILENAGE